MLQNCTAIISQLSLYSDWSIDWKFDESLFDHVRVKRFFSSKASAQPPIRRVTLAISVG